MRKHRLVLLLGVLVALVFFYLGLNTWMTAQEQQSTPPPVVRVKPPVQIKPSSEPVKPEMPQPGTEEETPRPKVVKLTPPEPKEEVKPEETKPEASEPKEEVKEEAPPPQPQETAQTQEKAEEVAKEQKEQAPAPRPQETSEEQIKAQPTKEEGEKPEEKTKELRDYVVQIGAFKLKENARKRLELAKSKGFDAFMIEEDGLYKVRVRVKAGSILSALREVRGEFREAFLVR